jgi:hypothetical protein
MFIPIVFSLTPSHHDLIYTWVFFKSLDFAKRYHWPLIAQSRYFNEWEKIYATYPNVLEKEFVEIYECDTPPRKADLQNIIPIEIPHSIERDYISRFSSETDAFLTAVTDNWPELEDYLVKAIQNAEKTTGEKTQGLMTLAEFAFIKNVGKKLGIPVIHYEWSSIRSPAYNKKLLYMDFNGHMGNAKLARRYHEFHKNAARVPILSRKEILALFLKRDDLKYLNDEENIPMYEFGMACAGSWPGCINAFSKATNMEMYTRLLRLFNNDDIYVRNHPGDSDSCVIHEAKHVSNDSTIEFILKSKRIISMSSNIPYEAALFSRPAYDLGFTHYKLITNAELEKLEDKVPTDEQLSFITFCFFLPYELFWTKEYLIFRLSSPSEEDLYMFHLSYYIKSLNLDENILSLPEEERLKVILSKRLDDQRLITTSKWKDTIGDWDENYFSRYIKIHQLQDDVSVLTKRINDLELKNQRIEIDLRDNIANLQQQLTSVISSRSYRMTQPLRKAMAFVRKINDNITI